MILSGYTLKNVQSPAIEVPAQAIFDLPEKVLQFGTGVLLRGLPDYFIDKANKKGIFNGRIVVVKSTDGGDAPSFDKQDGLYTICVRGIENGNKVEENIICASISRVLSAKNEWDKILDCARNPSLKIIISNTTEVGIELVNDDIKRYPPVSFPGKLLSFLYERYKTFGNKDCGMVIVPTELIVDNGKKLESIVTELAHLNGLDDAFLDWLENSNHFCNSLVDRIVPGKPDNATKAELEKMLGYKDELITMSEVYRLWAIEGDEVIANTLSFAAADEGVVIAKNIDLFRELKLRLLNGTHTLSSGIAFLSGLTTVKQAMDDSNMSDYISTVMRKEIGPAIPCKAADAAEAEAFALKVLDRFRNPGIEHHWLSITMQYSSKMQMRIVPVLLQYYKLFNTVPQNMALGFAAYILFMKAVKEKDGNYFGTRNADYYPIKDDKAAYFYEKWKKVNGDAIARSVLQDMNLWGHDLSTLPGFTDAVQEKIDEINERGMKVVLQAPASQKIPV